MPANDYEKIKSSQGHKEEIRTPKKTVQPHSHQEK